MNKLLIVFGLVILFVALPCAAEEENEDGSEDSEEVTDSSDTPDGNEGSDSSDKTDESDESNTTGGSDATDSSDSPDDDSKYVVSGKFVETDGKKQQCKDHTECYNFREPAAWCRPTVKQSWTDKGCFCDEEKHQCFIERMNDGEREYANCAPQQNWKCP